MSDLEYTVYVDPWYGYKVGLAPTWQRRGGKEQVAYYLDTPEGERLFEGDDLYPSPCYEVDGPKTAAAVLSFLTLKPGDTDDDYFDNYTPRQLEWCESIAAEELSCWAMDVEEGTDWEPNFTG